MVGAETNVKPVAAVVPPALVTDIDPDAPEPTVATMVLSEITTKAAAGAPPKLTDVVPVKLAPFMVTDADWPVVAGVKLLITGFTGAAFITWCCAKVISTLNNDKSNSITTTADLLRAIQR